MHFILMHSRHRAPSRAGSPPIESARLVRFEGGGLEGKRIRMTAGGNEAAPGG